LSGLLDFSLAVRLLNYYICYLALKNLDSLFRKKSICVADEEGHGTGMRRVLSVKDLTFFGIAAIIGGGTFSAIGNACYMGGPGVIFLYAICAVACGFTAMCYAEFASRVPVSGSAYTYAYITFGELFAWIIGWALILEYSIGNIFIAFSWSGYFTNLVQGIPEWLTTNYRSAHQAFLANIAGEGLIAWRTAPQIGRLRIIFDMPAVLINVVLTVLVFFGTRESRNLNNVMVIIKLSIIAIVIGVGVSHIDINNWTPFMPNGFNGVMSGVSAVFFAYIGFDAVSTLAEESKNPQKDLPRSMIYSLIICTIVYMVLAMVITGMASYKLLGVSDPLAEIFKLKGMKWMLFIVSIAAVVAMTSVLLVYQMGQPRIWMSMSRDGLLPGKFASIHPKYKTPGFATIITGLVVGVPIFFTNEQLVLDFTSIGTLFAFALVCGGIIILPGNTNAREKGKFKIPYVNSRYIVPTTTVASFVLIVLFYPDSIYSDAGNSKLNYPMIIFYIFWAVIAVFSYIKSFSLIPVMGLLSCCYLLTGMGWTNWTMFAVWLLIGLVIYFSYGYRKSKLAGKINAANQ